eukprot:gene27540-8794_t
MRLYSSASRGVSASALTGRPVVPACRATVPVGTATARTVAKAGGAAPKGPVKVNNNHGARTFKAVNAVKEVKAEVEAPEVKQVKAEAALGLKPQGASETVAVATSTALHKVEGREVNSPHRVVLSSPSVAVGNLVEHAIVVYNDYSLGVGGSQVDLPSPSVAVRNLVEHARFGHLCSVMSGMHHRRAGYPFGTLVDFATDGAGHPIFCLSPLAIHPRNLKEDSRTSLVVQMPGWTGLANARVTIFGDVHPLPEDLQDLQAQAANIFFAKHANERKERFLSGNVVYYRMNNIVDIYFVGGFGTVQWIDPAEYSACVPDEVVLNHPMRTLQALNEYYAVDLPKLIHSTRPADELTFISIDASGCDIRVRHGTEFTVGRLAFDSKVHNKREAMEAVEARLLAVQ